MPIILFLLGLFLIIFGIIEILYPKYMLNFIYNYIHNGPIKLTAIIMAFLGTPMIIKYNTSHYPAPILLLGILITLKSISALILPRNTIIIIYNFFYKKNFSNAMAFVLFSGYFCSFVGLFLIYSVFK